MNRAQVPVHHELKKAYFMALSRAFLMFDPILLNEVKKKIKSANPRMSDDDVDNYFYFTKLGYAALYRVQLLHRLYYIGGFVPSMLYMAIS